MLTLLFHTLRDLLRPRQDLILENLALRQTREFGSTHQNRSIRCQTWK